MASTSTPNRRPVTLGNSAVTSSVVRLSAATGTTCCVGRSVLEEQRDADVASRGRRVGHEDVGACVDRVAVRHGPSRRRRRRPSRDVRLVPIAVRPPHRALGDDGDVAAHHASRRRQRPTLDPRLAASRRRPRSSCGWPAAGRTACCRPRRLWSGSAASHDAAMPAGLSSSTKVSKKAPVAPSARNQCVDGAVTPLAAWPAANGSSGPAVVHGPLREDRLRRDNRGGDVRRDEPHVGGVHVERGAAPRRQGVGVDHRRHRRRLHPGDGGVGNRRVRVLEQIEQIEAARRRPLGEVPRRRRRGSAGLGVAAVRGAIPQHRPIDDDRGVGLHDGGERRAPQAVDTAHHNRPARVRREYRASR